MNHYFYVQCLVTQSSPTLCDPLDRSPPGTSVHGDSPGKNTGVGFYVLLQGIFPSQLKFRLLYTTRGGGVAGCCKLLGARILCFCSCSCRFGYNLAVNLQQNSCYLLFYNFLYEWKSVIPLKVRAFRMDYPVYFGL